MTSNRLSSLVMVSLLLVGSVALAESQAKLAVFPIELRGPEITEAQLGSLSSYLGKTAALILKVDVIAWQEIREVMRARELGHCSSRDCQMQAEREFGADYTVMVSLVKMGEICVTTATLYPRQYSASLLTALARGGCTQNDLRGGIESVVGDLVKAGKLTPVAKKSTPAVLGTSSAVVAKKPEPSTEPKPPTKSQTKPESSRGPRTFTPVQPPDSDDRSWTTKRPGAEVAPQKTKELEPSDADRGKSTGRLIDAWPTHLLTLNILYAPAPMVWSEQYEDEDDEQFTGDKLPDHFGAQVSFENRMAGYLLVGGHVNLLFAKDTYLVEGAVRFGGMLPLNEVFALHAFGWLGLSYWHVDNGDPDPDDDLIEGADDSSTSVQAGLGLGLRYLLTQKLGINFEMSAALGGSQNGEVLGFSHHHDVGIAKLQFTAGLFFKF